MIDAFIFDLDGVITDTAEYHYLAWKELANKIIQTYTYYPIAMVDLLNLIYPYLSQEDTITIDILKTEALNNALN